MKRTFCWHCGERVIGKLVQHGRFANCGHCPTWGDGCDDPRCPECENIDVASVRRHEIHRNTNVYKVNRKEVVA